MALTPMMQQYLEIKEKYKDCILFFRIGDFYEMFFDDAKIASRELELVLTGKDCGLSERAPMCGIPFHAADSYIGRLIGKGYKVAIGEQLQDPSLAKGLVERGIIRVVTPGTFNDAAFLEETKNNYILSLYYNQEENFIGLCFSDISTGEINCTSFKYNKDTVINEISRFNPSEILVLSTINNDFLESIKKRLNVFITLKDNTYFEDNYEENIKKQFKQNTEKLDYSIKCAVNGLLNYIYETQRQALSNIDKIEYYDISNFLSIDANSKRNLEICETMRDKTKKGSLLWVIDKTDTSMGGRLLRKWLEKPLKSKADIELRLNSVCELTENTNMLEDIKTSLNEIFDIERITGRISSKSVNARELLSLKNSIGKLPALKMSLKDCKSGLLKKLYDNIDTLDDVFTIIDDSIMDNPPLGIKEGNIINEAYNSEVYELRQSKLHGKEWIAALESREREETGIKSLKIGYNRVFGYYIEITRANYSSIPEGRYIRKQTLANAERFITPDLKEMENKILGAEERLVNLEYELFVNIREEIEKSIDRIKKSAYIISVLDCICSLAKTACDNNYIMPEINKTNEIKIKEGRHAVVEKMLPFGSFISNDTYINNNDNQLVLLTGPNMAGKSTYMRQIALIVILAHIGSFVPAKYASICICDKIFTRIGASDDLSSGKSTFMVEMSEVSNIVKNATKNSLVLLDEVGRGTSTFDGLSIAWSLIEYICSSKIKCKTLFATHYHELIQLEGMVDGVVNYCVAVKRIGSEIVFLRKIKKGGTDESYGIEVARLAGLPDKITGRAKKILASIENKQDIKCSAQEESAVSSINNKRSKNALNMQIGFEDIEKDSFIKDISKIDVLNSTPIDSMNKLSEIIEKAKKLR